MTKAIRLATAKMKGNVFEQTPRRSPVREEAHAERARA